MHLKCSCVRINWYLHLHKIIYKHKVMKNLFLICLFLFVIFIPQIGQSSNFPLLNPVDIEKVIDLDGSLAETPSRSLLPVPIQATISTSSLDVVFLSHVGNIEVEVYTASGSLVYAYNVDTQTQENLSIDVFGWARGTYQIHFVNSTGQYIYGSFEIE